MTAAKLIRAAVFAVAALTAAPSAQAGFMQVGLLTIPASSFNQALRSPAPRFWLFKGCTLYEQRDGQGQQWKYDTNSSAPVGDASLFIGSYKLNDPDNRISSVKCTSSASAECGVILYADRNHEGQTVQVMGRSGMVNLGDIDKQASSIRVVCDVQ